MNEQELAQVNELKAQAAVITEQLAPLLAAQKKLDNRINAIKHAAFMREHDFTEGETLNVTDELLRLFVKRDFLPSQVDEWRDAGTVKLETLEQRGSEVVGRLSNTKHSSGVGGVPFSILQRMKVQP